jgi:hypothetical protein
MPCNSLIVVEFGPKVACIKKRDASALPSSSNIVFVRKDFCDSTADRNCSSSMDDVLVRQDEEVHSLPLSLA